MVYWWKGLDEFRKKMINDKSLNILHDYMDSQDIFPNVAIEGGICYFLFDNKNEGPCSVFTHNKQTIQHSTRFLTDGNLDIFIRDEIARGIVLKVITNKGFKSFGDAYVQSRNYFKVSRVSSTDLSTTNQLSILGRFDNERKVLDLNPNFAYQDNFGLAPKWKIFESKADGAAGQIGNPIPARIIGKPEIGYPNEICTETFLVFGPFSKEEVVNVKHYITTKFFRFIVGVRKNKNMTQDTYKYVPVIDFSKPITDQELYSMYELTEEERDYIEKMITPMD